MQKDIHPKYQDVAFHDTAADHYIIIGSSLQTDKTVEIEGKTYPYFAIDISSASHPFYTGKQSVATQDGRVAKFNNRFGKLKS